MNDPIQELVESLAARLQRSVAVDDAGLGLIAHSRHYGDVDDARVRSLVGRTINGPLLDHILASGVRSWRGIGRVEPAPEHGSTFARLGVTLRSRHEVVGYMWVLDPHSVPLTDLEREATLLTAEQLEDLLGRRLISDSDQGEHIESAILGLLSTSPDERTSAAAELAEMGMFDGCVRFCGLLVENVIDPVPTPRTVTDMRASVELRRDIEEATAPLFRGSFGFAASGRESYLVLGYRRSPSPNDVRRVAATIEKRANRKRIDDLRLNVMVGIGGVQPTLDATHMSFDQAAAAIRAAHVRGHHLARWDDDPVASFLAAVLRPEIDRHMVPSTLARLPVEHSQEWLDLVEVYLTSAGSVTLTANRFNVHRTTVYYRIARFQEATGIDLENGDQRLMLQLWFKARAYTRLR